MKNFATFVFICVLGFLFSNCGQQPKAVGPAKVVDAQNDFIAKDSIAKFIPLPLEKCIDTVYDIKIDGEAYRLVLSNEVPSDEGALTKTVRLVNENHDTLFKKTLVFNEILEFSSPAPNCYWLTLVNSGGGSGYSGTVFYLRMKPEITLQPLVNINELSCWKANRTATEFILFQGNWDMSGSPEGENFESHFSDHKQWVGVYTILQDTVSMKEIGMTKMKHGFIDNDFVLEEFQKDEPELAKAIHLNEYKFAWDKK